ncbi:MAG TPA: biotin carboxylase N-terminal domain-containing protein [Pseudonocardiaceae bacterium]
MRIRKLLVANRGEIAARVMRTARAMDIATVAVHSDPDADAPFVAAADEAVRLPGATPAETYLDIQRVIGAARVTGADAVHPGYGFLSENAAFARACEAAGLVFVGPPPEAIEAMGSKIAAKALMSRAGVPVLPDVTLDGGTGDTGEDLDATEIGVRVGRDVGYPVLVKAAFGGGGRGMRVVRKKTELADAVTGARREAVAAFGDGTLFLERYVDRPRHVEVQIFGDSHGNVVSLFERECSIQRRYQKIIEESPSPAVDDELRAELSSAAVAAGKAIGYVGAGTVEFVLAPDGEFYFLEVNTRLQVEHPVTECVTGLDLVRLQLLVAEGKPLPPEVLTAELHGHAVEARLYAEQVPAGFLPVSGTLRRFAIPEPPGVRVDAGVADGSVVSTHYDPMLAKVIAHGPTREEACRTLARALADARLTGLVTNRTLLVNILREPEFLAGRIDTGYLGRHDPAVLGAGDLDADALAIHAVAAALAGQAERRAAATVLTTLPSGWRNVPSEPQRVSFQNGERELDVRYRFTADGVRASLDGVELPGLRVLAARPDRVRIEVAGVRRDCLVDRAGEVYWVDSPLGTVELTELPRFPEPGAVAHVGSLLAPMPGTVVSVGVSPGERVAQGAAVVVLEAMKMEHTVRAPADGVVSAVDVAVGQQVDTGTVLAVIDSGEDS